MKKIIVLWAATMLSLSGGLIISETRAETGGEVDNQSTQMPVALSAAEAVSNPNRLSDDYKDDELRKPVEVLEFIDIPEGAVVVEIEASRGYYTELLSPLVGSSGSVTMVNPPFFDVFITAEDIAKRLGENGDRLPNVSIVKTKFDALPMADNSVDVVTWILGPHELYFIPQPGVDFGDVEKTYAEIFRVLKPGGIFVPLDHAAASGSPATTGGQTHRIDPAIVRQEAGKVGLVFESSSNILSNPADQYEVSVFDDKTRRKTDRFLHKYRKPKQ